MAEKLTTRIKHAWNAFMNKDPTTRSYGSGYYSNYRPDRLRMTRGNERSIINSVINRMAVDCESIDIKHVRVNDDRYVGDMDSDLNNCLTLEANLDQTARSFRRDVVMTMLDEGCVAIVPTDTTDNPNLTDSYDIEEMRAGVITEWHPDWVKVNLYNERTGERKDISIKKRAVSIVENPFFSVMNEPNSTAQRLIRKLNLLDAVDEASSSGKLDLIIQLPYVIKTEARRQQAEERRKMIEDQLSNGKLGIAYTDGTEHVIQLNRAVENNLMTQIEYLTSMLFSQLGITQGILDGTADDKTMNNYYTRTIEPLVSAIVDEMKRKFLSKTARTRGQSIMYFRNPFKLVPISEIPDMADKFTRNEILTSNEVRQIVGFKPSDDPKADKLINANINQASAEEKDAIVEDQLAGNEMSEEEYEAYKKDLDDVDAELSKLEAKAR